MHEDIEEILYTKADLDARVCELGAQISKDYAGINNLLVVGILKGSTFFMCDLIRSIDLPLQMDFMACSSYGSAAQSSGVVNISKDLNVDIAGKNVLLVEDIIDTGITLNYLKSILDSRGAASIKIATLFLKQGTQRVEVKADYVGFPCPDAFIVGYGLDYAERYRNLPFVGVLKKEIYA